MGMHGFAEAKSERERGRPLRRMAGPTVPDVIVEERWPSHSFVGALG
jgi:hypothetical protein